MLLLCDFAKKLTHRICPHARKYITDIHGGNVLKAYKHCHRLDWIVWLLSACNSNVKPAASMRKLVDYVLQSLDMLQYACAQHNNDLSLQLEVEFRRLRIVIHRNLDGRTEKLRQCIEDMRKLDLKLHTARTVRMAFANILELRLRHKCAEAQHTVWMLDTLSQFVVSESVVRDSHPVSGKPLKNKFIILPPSGDSISRTADVYEAARLKECMGNICDRIAKS